MRQGFILIFIAAFLFSFSLKQEDDDVISWDENKPLTWNDFKELPQNNSVPAYASCGLLRSVAKSMGNTASVKIQTVFFCRQSWKNEKKVNGLTLLHEQKHFDIAELHARKLRKLVTSQNYHSITQLRRKTDSLYSVVEKEMAACNALYDHKTGLSKHKGRQSEWNAKITNNLASLNEYSEPVFIITFK